MKKLFLALIILSFTGVAFAASVNTTYVLTEAETATGAAAPQDVRYAYKTWGCDIVTFANMSSGVVRIEGNQAGTLYDPAGMGTHTLTSAQLTAGIGSFVITDAPVKQVRANIVSLSGGANPSLTVRCTGRE